jgi:hypothetical protein
MVSGFHLDLYTQKLTNVHTYTLKMEAAYTSERVGNIAHIHKVEQYKNRININNVK